jgi:hypothetical protein
VRYGAPFARQWPRQTSHHEREDAHHFGKSRRATLQIEGPGLLRIQSRQHSLKMTATREVVANRTTRRFCGHRYRINKLKVWANGETAKAWQGFLA